ncbi:alpha/beta hydrolase [Granulicella sp. WH15]|uniref:alpha/beta fold hydrolase n=1 Tax=Granulicella sp. WH15 TaxID=2602070 RepID=UPI001366F7DD|nr:alpha/beta hydrolase [Granulicella sp. WH15]QHN05132.1 alpha/beta hydrolase [Granulicella sp. WH15]
MSDSRSIASVKGSLLLLLAILVLPVFGYAADHGAKPCTTATPECTEWVTLGGGPSRAMIYRSYPLSAKSSTIRRALIMVHGTNRNADHYFRTATSAAFLAGALDDTIVISPSFLSADRGCNDKLQPNEVSWSCRGDSWRSGGVSLSNKDLTSFDFIDEILRKLADKKMFPNLTQVVIAGHSAGGQFVARYEMANRVHDTLGISISYVVSNPSSYAWPDATRALPTGDAAPEAAVAGWKSEAPHTDFSYGPFDATKDPKYDLWPYGLEQRTEGYTVKMSDEQLKKQLVSRPTTYLLSQVDTLPLGGFDSGASAMAQGATRRARGEAYVKYINEKMGAKANIMIIPECGHNDRCVYTTDSALNVIFPKP